MTANDGRSGVGLTARALFRLDWGYRFGFLGVMGRAYRTETRLRGIALGYNAAFFGRPILMIHPGSSVSIGDDCVLVSNSRRCSTANLYRPVRLQTDNDSSTIAIGRGSGLNGVSIWCRSTSVILGEEVALGPNVTIMNSPAHALWPPQNRSHYPGVELDKPVVIGDHVWEGNGALILPGATVGKNSVIAARSVVTGEIPPNCLAAGTPAKLVRYLN